MYLIISSSPNPDGLTAACAGSALAGLLEAGAQAQQLDLCKLTIERCRQCGNGWGICREKHVCVIEDHFSLLHEVAAQAEGIVIVTPVYWGDMSESAKSAFDRLRRCEAPRGEESALKDKPIIAIAAAGGSGNGVVSCLEQIERLIKQMRGQVVDLIGITRRSRAYKLEAIRAAARAMAEK
jgi:multimeric flavodoxin WrbA